MHLVKKAIKAHKHLRQPEPQKNAHASPMTTTVPQTTEHTVAAPLQYQQHTVPFHAVAAPPTTTHNTFPLPRGNATWVYDYKGGESAMWRSYLQSFNDNNNHNPINIVYTYGGDLEVQYHHSTHTPQFTRRLTDAHTHAPYTYAHAMLQYYPGSGDPLQTYFPAENQKAGE